MRRSEFLKVTGAVVLLPIVPTIAAEARRTLVASKCIWGIGATPNLDSNFWPYSASLESKFGRKFAGFRYNGVEKEMPNLPTYNACYDHGWHWGYANGKPQPAGGNYTGYWKDTANGKYDAFWRSYFQTVKADNRWTTSNPIHFSFHHEQYVKSEGGGSQAGTPADYAAAFRHVRGIMDSQNAHVKQGGNMLATFSPHWRQFDSSNPYYVYKCDPGAAYYDLLGVDLYCPQKQTHTASSQWTPVHDFAVHVGKPFFTGEQGVAGSDSKVVSYLKQLDTLLKSWGAGYGPGEIAALNFTTRVAADGDYRMDLTAARLAQYKSMANDPFYGAVV